MGTETLEEDIKILPTAPIIFLFLTNWFYNFFRRTPIWSWLPILTSTILPWVWALELLFGRILLVCGCHASHQILNLLFVNMPTLVTLNCTLSKMCGNIIVIYAEKLREHLSWPFALAIPCTHVILLMAKRFVMRSAIKSLKFAFVTHRIYASMCW